MENGRQPQKPVKRFFKESCASQGHVLRNARTFSMRDTVFLKGSIGVKFDLLFVASKNSTTLHQYVDEETEDTSNP